MTTDPARDRERVRDLLGREPLGAYEVVVRDDAGEPVVIRNAPLLDDGTPMPTRYWLVGAAESRRVGRLEADGGVRRAEQEVDPGELAAAHARYAAERDAALPADVQGAVPTGGVGGTRVGVKCLHAHYAWHLAGGDDPVGRWVADELDRLDAPRLRIDDDTVTLTRPDRWTATLPFGAASLASGELAGSDPPAPEELTNALGIVEDHVTGVTLEHEDLVDAARLVLQGAHAVTIARVEIGADEVPPGFVLTRDAAEDVFRTVATERERERAHNPGLPPDEVRTVVGSAVIVVAAMRRLHLAEVLIDPALGAGA